MLPDRLRSRVQKLAVNLMLDFAFLCGKHDCYTPRGKDHPWSCATGSVYYGHGASINMSLQSLAHSMYGPKATAGCRLFPTNHYGHPAPIESVFDGIHWFTSALSAIDSTILWDRLICRCQSSIHDFDNESRDQLECSIWGGRYICNKCKEQLSFGPIYHPAKETAREKTERDKMTAKLRWSILESGGFRCRVCGHGASAENPLHVDHIVPVSLGGKTVPENLQILCSRCNLGKGASMPTQSALDFWEQMEK